MGSETASWTMDTTGPTILNVEELATSPRNIVFQTLDVELSIQPKSCYEYPSSLILFNNFVVATVYISNKSISISRGGIAPLGEYRDIWIFKKIDAILKRSGFTLTTPIKDLPEGAIKVLLYGDKEPVAVSSVKYPGTAWHTKFEGIIRFLESITGLIRQPHY